MNIQIPAGGELVSYYEVNDYRQQVSGERCYIIHYPPQERMIFLKHHPIKLKFPHLYFVVRTSKNKRGKRRLEWLSVWGAIADGLPLQLDLYEVDEFDGYVCLGKKVKLWGKDDEEVIQQAIAGFWQTTFQEGKPLNGEVKLRKSPENVLLTSGKVVARQFIDRRGILIDGDLFSVSLV